MFQRSLRRAVAVSGAHRFLRIEAKIPQLRLEYRLPLLVSVVLTALLGAGTWLAYDEVRAASHSAAVDRMDAVAMQLTETARNSVETRSAVMREVAADRLLAEVVRGSRAMTDPAVLELLEGLEIGTEDGFAVAIVPAHGAARVAVVGSAYPDLPPPTLDGAAMQGSARLLFSDFITADSATYYWMLVPITAEPAGGYLGQLRRLPGSIRTVRDLVGEGADVFFVVDDAGPWAQFGGVVVEPPVTLSAAVGAAGRDGDGGALRYDRSGVDRIAVAQRVASTNAWLVIDRPVEAVLAPARTFVWRLAAISMLLVMAGLLIVGWLSRRLVQPITELGAAARDIALGAYDRRVELDRSDEIGQLADAFNSMASEIERTIASARHSQSAAQQASQAKSAFLATMSHEVRTPINAIMGYVELLDMRVSGELNQDQQQYIERIRESSRHLTGLVEDVLDLAKVEAGELRVAPRPCMADAAAKSALGVVAPQARLRGIELTSDCSAIAFIGDPQRVRQILVNLLSNAIKFTDAGGHVSLHCYLDGPRPNEPGHGGACCFEVSDTGCGIPAEQYAAIFEPFVQLDSSYTRSRGGAGLGLAISRRLARMMEGDIEIESEAGRGSTFTLRLPVPAPVAEPVAAGP